MTAGPAAAGDRGPGLADPRPDPVGPVSDGRQCVPRPVRAPAVLAGRPACVLIGPFPAFASRPGRRPASLASGSTCSCATASDSRPPAVRRWRGPSRRSASGTRSTALDRDPAARPVARRPGERPPSLGCAVRGDRWSPAGSRPGPSACTPGRSRSSSFVAAIQLAWMLVTRDPGHGSSSASCASGPRSGRSPCSRSTGPSCDAAAACRPSLAAARSGTSPTCSVGPSRRVRTVVRALPDPLLDRRALAGRHSARARSATGRSSSAVSGRAVVAAVVAGRRTTGRAVHPRRVLVAIPLLDAIAIVATPSAGAARDPALLPGRPDPPLLPVRPGRGVAALGIEAILGPATRPRQRDPPTASRTSVWSPSSARRSPSSRCDPVWRARSATLAQFAEPADRRTGRRRWLLGARHGSPVVVGGRRAARAAAPRPAPVIVGPVLVGLALLLLGERAPALQRPARSSATIRRHVRRAPRADARPRRFLLAQPGIAGERVLTFGDDANRMALPGPSPGRRLPGDLPARLPRRSSVR